MVLYHPSLLLQQTPGGLSDFKGKPRSYFWDLSQVTAFVCLLEDGDAGWLSGLAFEIIFEKIGKLEFMWPFPTKAAPQEFRINSIIISYRRKRSSGGEMKRFLDNKFLSVFISYSGPGFW